MEEVGLEAIAIHVLKLMKERGEDIKEMAQSLSEDVDNKAPLQTEE